MKKLGLLFATLFVTLMFVNAQPGNFDPEAMIQRQVDQIKEACDLTDEQVPQVKAVVKKYSDKMMELFQDMGPGGDREAMREKMTENREKQTQEIKEILTDEQDAKYDAFLEEQAERRRNRGGGGFGG
jgi:periplasmic protein CpxP/Spy